MSQLLAASLGPGRRALQWLFGVLGIAIAVGVFVAFADQASRWLGLVGAAAGVVGAVHLHGLLRRAAEHRRQRLLSRRVTLRRLRAIRGRRGLDGREADLLRSALETVGTPVVVLDSRGRIVCASRRTQTRHPALGAGKNLRGFAAPDVDPLPVERVLSLVREASAAANTRIDREAPPRVSVLRDAEGATAGYLLDWSATAESMRTDRAAAASAACPSGSRDGTQTDPSRTPVPAVYVTAVTTHGGDGSRDAPGLVPTHIAALRLSADIVLSAANGLTSRMENLSQRTRRQAAAFEHTAASIEQLSTAIRQTADNASQANQLASAMRELALRGGDVVTRAVDAMRAIDRCSRKIAEIVGVIDEIAFQTSLLALNAAVEAARAGEQGRGFAVVAAEVRTLAQRSAESAQQIKSLIQDSVLKVRNGTQLVDESGRTLGDIVVSVKRVTDLIAEISAAGREQAGGVEGIDRVLLQTEQVAGENAALAEDSLQAARFLVEQSAALVELAGRCGGPASAGPLPPPRPPEVATLAESPADPGRNRRGAPVSSHESEHWETF